MLTQELSHLKNVLVLLSDDHALHTTGAYGNSIINTPNIDRLADEGIIFTEAYCNAPICSASRQSLLTGKYAHATGVNLLFTPFPDKGNTTIAEHLSEFGYVSALFGKSHFNNWIWSSIYKKGLPDHGFNSLIQAADYRSYLKQLELPLLPENVECYNQKHASERVAEWMNHKVLPQPVFDKYSEGTYYARQAIEFMRQNKEKPFLAWLAFKEPHHPYYFPLEFAGKYDPQEMPLPEGSQEDDRWIPQKFMNLSDDEKRGIIASYYTSTEYMDKNIGLVLDALDEMSLSETTLVIYISDNGYLLNDHRRFEKHTMWQEAIHLPLILRAGNQQNRGACSRAMVEYVDIVPTILDILGIPAIDQAQGRSFRRLLKEVNAPHKEFVFAEYLEDNLAMVKTQDWKYVFTTGSRDLGIGYQTGYGPSGIVHRLYNLKEDSKETKDVSGDPANQDIFKNMQNLMLKHFMDTHPDADNCPENLTIEGKLVWFCEPRDIGANQLLKAIPMRVFK